MLLTQQPPGTAGYGAAADQDQAALLIDSIAGFVQRTPGLAGAVKVTGRRVTNVRTGATFEALAADLASSWGLRPAFLVVDEIAQHASGQRQQDFFAALHSATGKLMSRMVLLTSAGDDAHWSHRILEHAGESAAWRVSAMPGPLPWADEGWLVEQRALLPEWQYARLHLNQWVGADDRLTSVDALRRCVTLDGPLAPERDRSYVVAVDLGLKNDRTVGVVAHLETLDGGLPAADAPAQRVVGERERIARVLMKSGAIGRYEFDERVRGYSAPEAPEEPAQAVPVRVVLDRIEVWQGSRLRPVQIGTVESWIMQASHSFNGAPVIVDPWQATGMAQRLRTRGVSVDEFVFSSASVGRLASTLHQLLRDGALALPDDEALPEELANVRLVERTPGVVRLDHDPGRHDDRAVSVAMAAQFLLARRPEPAAWSGVSSYRSEGLRGIR